MKKEGMDLKEQGKAYEKVWKKGKEERDDKIDLKKQNNLK